MKTIAENKLKSAFLAAALAINVAAAADAAPMPEGYSTPFVTGISITIEAAVFCRGALLYKMLKQS